MTGPRSVPRLDSEATVPSGSGPSSPMKPSAKSRSGSRDTRSEPGSRRISPAKEPVDEIEKAILETIISFLESGQINPSTRDTISYLSVRATTLGETKVRRPYQAKDSGVSFGLKTVQAMAEAGYPGFPCSPAPQPAPGPESRWPYNGFSKTSMDDFVSIVIQVRHGLPKCVLHLY